MLQWFSEEIMYVFKKTKITIICLHFTTENIF